jgi:hypothetical protein
MAKYVGFYIIDTTDKNGVRIHQPKLLKNIKASFMDLLEENTRVFKPKLAPKSLVIHSKEGDPLILPKKQKQFSWHVIILDLTFSSQKFNFSQGIIKSMTEIHFKALLCTIKYIIVIEDLG